MFVIGVARRNIESMHESPYNTEYPSSSMLTTADVRYCSEIGEVLKQSALIPVEVEIHKYTIYFTLGNNGVTCKTPRGCRSSDAPQSPGSTPDSHRDTEHNIS